MERADFHGQSCSSIAGEIHDLIHAHFNSPCAGDLDIAAAHIEAADMSLDRGKVEQALKSLDYAARELGEISHTRTYCAELSPDVKHILANVIRTRGDIEAWERMQAMNKKAS